MVDTLPLAPITVSAMHTVRAMCILRQVTDTMTTDMLEHRTVRAIVEVAGNQYLDIRRQGIERINRLTEAICHGLTEWTTIPFTAIATGCMDHEYMQCVARRD